MEKPPGFGRCQCIVSQVEVLYELASPVMLHLPSFVQSIQYIEEYKHFLTAFDIVKYVLTILTVLSEKNVKSCPKHFYFQFFILF